VFDGQGEGTFEGDRLRILLQETTVDKVTLGTLATAEANRDAVHVAITPMVATKVMTPGEHLTNGIVDPYLTKPVQPGQRFWLLLYPNTVTSLRHVWTHPAFNEE
jgi:hypothetical protein